MESFPEGFQSSFFSRVFAKLKRSILARIDFASEFELASRQSLQRRKKVNPRFTFAKLVSLYAKNVRKQAISNAECDTAVSLRQVHVTSEKRQSCGLKLPKILQNVERHLEGIFTPPKISTPGRNRTCDTSFRKAVLYPLSYRGLCGISADDNRTTPFLFFAPCICAGREFSR